MSEVGEEEDEDVEKDTGYDPGLGVACEVYFRAFKDRDVDDAVDELGKSTLAKDRKGAPNDEHCRVLRSRSAGPWVSLRHMRAQKLTRIRHKNRQSV